MSVSVRLVTEAVECTGTPQTFLLSLVDVFYMFKVNIKKNIQLKILLIQQGGRYTPSSILTLTLAPMFSSDESKDLLQLADRDGLL